MSIAERPATRATFGAGGAEPYARALRHNASDSLFMHETRLGELTSRVSMDFAKWNADADATDLSLLRAVSGPVLDIGCGPGRMVRAAMELGMVVLGLDVSPTAIEMARESGLPVLEGSVFESVPDEGAWQTTLLVDGNIGIGGDVSAMLGRCRQLLAPAGEVVIELDDDPDRDYTFIGTLVDADGGQSATFPWAEVGINPLMVMAAAQGLRLTQSWVLGGRTFCRLAKIPR